MITMLKDDGVYEALESAIIQMGNSVPMTEAIAKAIAKDKKLMALVAKFVAHQAIKKVYDATQQSVIVGPPSLPLVLGESPSSKAERKSPQRSMSPQRKKIMTSSASNDRGTWSTRHSIKEKYGSKASISEENAKEMKQPGTHQFNVGYTDALDHRTYRLHHRLLKYNAKMAKRTAKLVKIMETIIKTFKTLLKSQILWQSFHFWVNQREPVTSTEYLKA